MERVATEITLRQKISSMEEMLRSNIFIRVQRSLCY